MLCGRRFGLASAKPQPPSRRGGSVAFIALALAGFAGCGGGDDTPKRNLGPKECELGEWTTPAGTCAGPGLPADMSCPPGEHQDQPGVCVRAGVPPGACGAGFTHDGEGACNPVLPSGSCLPGEMAIVGESACRAVSPCAVGGWGSIPVEPGSQHVDAAYAGTGSDGSATKPWKTIGEAIKAAKPGAIVAVAEGTYPEDVFLDGKSVRLWGRCPGLVELSGQGAQLGAIVVFHSGAGKTEVHGLAITGKKQGIVVSGAENVLVDSVWVHDTQARGLDIEGTLGPTAVSVQNSLIELAHEGGIHVSGAALTLERSVVRGTVPQGAYGRGLNIQDRPATTQRSSLILRASVIEQNQGVGVYVRGSDALIEETVVRDTVPGATDPGHGVEIVDNSPNAVTAVLRKSVIERNQLNGVVAFGADAIVEDTVVRSTSSDALGLHGRGISVQYNQNTGVRGSFALRRSLLDQNHGIGLFVSSTDATVESTVIRETAPDATGAGRGVMLQNDGGRASLQMLESVVELSTDMGIVSIGSDVDIRACVIRDTLQNPQGGRGAGVQLQLSCAGGLCDPSRRSKGAVQASLIENNYEAGVFVLDSDASIDSCLVRATHANATGLYGDGIVIAVRDATAQAEITGTRVEQSARAGVSNFGADVALGSSLLLCQGFDIDSELGKGGKPVFHDNGGTYCGCPEATAQCKAISSQLAAPEPVDAVEP